MGGRAVAEILTGIGLIVALLVVLIALCREKPLEPGTEMDDGTTFVGYDGYGAPLYLHQIDGHGRE